MKIKKLMNTLEFFYPTKYAEDYDNVGLIIGDERRDVSRVLTTLEITNEVIDEAIERNVELIVCHHPILFRPIKNLNYKDPYVRMYIKLIKNDIAVYAMHTNVDVAPNGMSDWISEVLEISSANVFIATKHLELFNLTIEANQDNLYEILDLLKKIGIGQQDGYVENAKIAPKIKYYSTPQIETTQCDIVEINVQVSADLKTKVIYELKKNNYTEFNLVKLENNQNKIGIGKVGYIKPQTLEDLAGRFKELYDLDFCKFVGNREQIIKKIAIVPGSGSEFIADAKRQGCDALITGDIGFHDAQLAKAANLALIDPGHNIEIIFNDAMCQIINLFDGITAIASEIDTEPFEVV